MLISNNMTGSNQVKNYQQGFTLIELLMIVAIMAVVVTLAAPSMSKEIADRRVKETAKTIETALKDAKAQSVILRKNVTVTYDAGDSDKAATISLFLKTATVNDPKKIASYQINDSSEVKMVSGDPEAEVTSIVFTPYKRIDGNAVKFTICDSSSSQEVPIELTIDVIANMSAKHVTNGGSCS